MVLEYEVDVDERVVEHVQSEMESFVLCRVVNLRRKHNAPCHQSSKFYVRKPKMIVAGVDEVDVDDGGDGGDGECGECGECGESVVGVVVMANQDSSSLLWMCRAVGSMIR